MNAPLPAHLLAPVAHEPAAERAGATTALATVLPAGAAHWDLVWDASPAGQLLLNGAGRITHINRCAAHGLGWNDERLAAHRARGEPVALASALSLHDGQGLPVPADDLPGLKALRTGLPEAERVLALRLGATQRWLSFSATRLSDAGGVHGVLLNVNDVTQRMQTERERVTEWEHTLEIIKGSRLGLWHSSPWEQRLFLDAQASQLLGLSPQLTPEQALHRWGKAIHPEDNERVWSTIKQHLKGGLISSVTEARVLLPNGQWRWLRTRTHTLQGTGGTENVKLAGTVEDVTEIKGIEAEVQHGHDLLHTLFTHAPMGIQLLDLGSGRTVMCNQALADICGTSIEHMLNRSPDERSSPQTSARRVQWRHDLLGNGSTGPHEFSIRRPDNSWRDVRMSAVRVFDPKGRAFAWAVVQDITATKAYEAQLKAAATRDRLTSMPNRAAMLAHMQELLALARANPDAGFATLFLDFDRFKLVNDTLGHAVGDELLCEIADRLRGLILGEPGAMAARFGGDEFVLTLPGVNDPEDLVPFVERLTQALKPAYFINGHELHSSASIGVAFSGARKPDTETLLREADIAMYEAKRRGRSQVVYFGAEMDARLQRSVLIDNSLRHAVARGELSVAYQPIVDLNDRRMISAEALVRWSHPTLGPISPAEFIPVAEESGHILGIGEWVLRESCRQWMLWDQRSPERRPQTVSVNLSRLQLSQGQRLIQVVQAALADTGMRPEHLQLEVTEREVMGPLDDMVGLLRELHALGIKLAMDDFGTGASSLGCLRDLPFDVIKIDKSFMADLSRDMQALAIAQATIQVIENLGMRSVAEGVENAEDVSVLQALGCQYGQGYLFCRPVPGDRLLDGWS